MNEILLLDFGFHKGEGLAEILEVLAERGEDISSIDVHSFDIQNLGGTCPSKVRQFSFHRLGVGPHDQFGVVSNGGENTECTTILEANKNYNGQGEMVAVVSPANIYAMTFAKYYTRVFAKIDIEGSEFAFFAPFVEKFTNLTEVWMESHRDNELVAPENTDWPEWDQLIEPARRKSIPVHQWR